MFKDRFKELRKETGLTQDEFAKDFGVSLATVAMWETGRRVPSYKKLLKLADYFHVNIAQLEETSVELDKWRDGSEPGAPLYDAEKLILTILSLDKETQHKIAASVYSAEKKGRREHTLQDVRNIFADIRIFPEEDEEIYG